MNILTKFAGIVSVLLSVMSTHAEVVTDVQTRNMTIAKPIASGEVRISWYGEGALTESEHIVELTSDAGVVLAKKSLSISLAKANQALKSERYFSSDWVTLSSSELEQMPKSVYVNVVNAKNLTARQEQDASKQVQKAISTLPIVYVATDVKVDKTQVTGNESVTITGKVVEVDTQQPLPFVQTKIIVANNQFEIPIVVNSDETGHFKLVFRPQGKMFGVHRVSVVNPDDSNRPEQVSFNVQKRVKIASRVEKPADLQFTTSLLKTGVRFEDRVMEKVLIENKGDVRAKQAKVSLTSKDGYTWGRIVSQDENEVVDQDWEVHVEFTPPETFKEEGEYEFTLKLEYGSEPNVVTKILPVKVSVTNNVVGAYKFKVEDLYTDYEGKGGNDGVVGARVTLTNDKVSAITSTLSTNEKGFVSFANLPVGFYSYQVSADNHTSEFGEVYVRSGVEAEEKIFLNIPVVKVNWSVTETTIEDTYEIIVDATYETDVPAPVIIVEPPVVVLPALKRNEVLKGSLKITNDGLVSAEEFIPDLPTSDNFVTYQFDVEALPDKILPQQTLYLPYVIKARRDFELSNNDVAETDAQVSGRSKKFELKRLLTASTARGRTCSYTIPYGFSTPANFSVQWTCANEEETKTETGTTYTYTGSKTFSYDCSSSPGRCSSEGGCGWYWWWGCHEGQSCGSGGPYEGLSFDFEFPGIFDCSPYLPNTCEE